MKTIRQRAPPTVDIGKNVGSAGRRRIDREFRRPRKPAEHRVRHGRRHRAERQRAGRIAILPGPAATLISRLIPQLPAKVVWVVHLVLQKRSCTE
jgi:hypothetical protein